MRGWGTTDDLKRNLRQILLLFVTADDLKRDLGRITLKIVNEKKAAIWLPFAPPTVEMLNLWNDFRKVVEFMDENRAWLLPLIEKWS